MEPELKLERSLEQPNSKSTPTHDSQNNLNLEPDGEEIWIEVMDDANVELIAESPFKLEEEEDQDSPSNESKPAERKECNACGMSFKFLGRHLSTHGPHNCSDCLLHFPTKELYEEHIQNVHNREKESHICSTCDLGFSSLTRLAIHNFKHTQSYSCPLCKFIVKGKHKHSLINHIKRHEGQFSVFCELCGQGFIEKHMLVSHMEIHEGIPKYQCEFCKKKFTVKRYLDVHRNLNHKKELYGIEESFQCEICGRSFSFEKSLVRHLSAIHKIGEDRTVDCPVCKKKIANNHNLKKHMRVHTGEKRFCCDTCGKAFAEKKYLQKHQAGHEKEKNRRKRPQESFGKFDLAGVDVIEDLSSLSEGPFPEYLVYQDSDEDDPDASGSNFLFFTCN